METLKLLVRPGPWPLPGPPAQRMQIRHIAVSTRHGVKIPVALALVILESPQ
jgi:hypothetical protein